MKIDLKNFYKQQIAPALKNRFRYKNRENIPKLVKISVNRGVGEAAKNSKELESSIKEISLITGQKPRINKALKSIAGFKIREGMPVGLSVTLRNSKMYNFLTKLIHLVFPRVRDFRGLDPTSFDRNGNYNFGLDEQLIFPEISYDDVSYLHGLDVALVATSKTDIEGHLLMQMFGVPFIERPLD